MKEHAARGERTMLAALLLSAPGPIVTGIAVASSQSTTQIADFLRRSAELVAIFVSWWIYRKLQRDTALGSAARGRLEHTVSLSVAGAMTCSGVVMSVLAASRLSAYKPSGNVTLGLVIAALGLATNTLFWIRYRALAREQAGGVIAAQERMYRAKSLVDLCVVTALMAVAVAPAHPATRYVDILGSLVVACYLVWNGLRTMRGQRHESQQSLR